MTGFAIQTGRRLREMTGDRRQVASVRRIVLDDGPERGVRALVFSTGGGLDFWVMSDHSMDIGPLWWRGTQLAWQHPGGFKTAALHDPYSDARTGIERALSGFLVTCGLENVRQPRQGYPLHGSLPLTPARVTGYGEDWDAENPVLFAEGEVTVAHLRKTSFRMYRRFEAPIGGRSICLTDRIENIGPEPAEMMVLYHNNFGYPMIDQGSSVSLNGTRVWQAEAQDPPVTTSATSYDVTDQKQFSAALEWPATGGRSGLKLSIKGESATLPFVQIWSDPRSYRHILSIEPSNCGRADDGTSLPGTMLDPGESWTSTQHYKFAPTAPATE